jgi:hypothetical protein
MYVAALVLGAGAAAAAPAPEGSWSVPQTLVPTTENAFDSQLAVTADGQALAGWIGGEPLPVVSAPPGHGAAREAVSSGETVVVDRGTLIGGFEPPTLLSAPTMTDFSLQIAVSGSGTSYAVWENGQDGAILIATAAPGQPFSTPRELLPRHTREVALVQSPGGPVVVVWFTVAPRYSAAPTVLHYARLRADGTLEPAVTVGRMGVAGESEPFALNNQGAFAAIGFAAEGPSGKDLYLPFVAVCDPEGRCSRRHLHKLGRISHGSLGQLAIALAEDGTVSVLASYQTVLSYTPSPREELWDVVRHPDGRWGTAHKLSGIGSFPVATPYGQHGALTVFQTPNSEGFAGGLAWSALQGTSDRFAGPVAVSGPNSPYPPVLAANTTGAFAMAWYANPPGLANPANESLAAATGSNGNLSPAQVISTGNVAAKTIHTGIDAVGEVIVSWSDWLSSDSHGAQPRGFFVVVHHP